MDTKQLIADLLTIRRASRSDLLFLCNHILQYKDVSKNIHGDLIEGLQKFPVVPETLSEKGQFTTQYGTPWTLPGPRSRLFLFPRVHLKTTIITIAHTIQWILNFPDIRMLISTATSMQSEAIMGEMKAHFQFNPTLRRYFPEFCPPAEHAAKWGNQSEFTVPRRTKHRKEPTVSTCSVGMVVAGMHYEVVKNSDLVDKENVKTPGAIAAVISHFNHLDPLLERSEIAPHRGWMDVEGTRYDFGDLYGRLIEGGKYQVVLRPRDDEETVWPERFPPSEMKRIEEEVGPWIFSCQYRNRPIPPEGGLCGPDDVMFVPRSVIEERKSNLRIHCTIDLHGMETHGNDFTVLTVGGFDTDGRLYIMDIRRGRFTPFEVIAQIFDIHSRYPTLVDFKIEKDAHARVLLPFLQREMSKRHRYPIIVPLKRDTHTSKASRIRGLQAWFKTGIIRFVTGLSHTAALLEEISRFPSTSSGVHDDILDTLADMMQNQEGGVTDDVIADDRSGTPWGQPRPRDRFLGFDEEGKEQWVYGDTAPVKRSPTGLL